MKFNEKTMQKMAVVAGLAVLANLLWGSAAPTIKTGYAMFQVASNDTASIILFAGIRFTLAGILAIIIGSLISGELLIPRKSSIPKLCVLAVFQTIIQYILFYIGCAHTTGTKATILSSTSAFLSIFVSALLFGQEKLSSKKLFGCLLGFAGVLLVNLRPGESFDLDMSLLGEGFVILSTLSLAISNCFTKHFSKTENPMMLSGYQFVLGGSVMVFTGLAAGGSLSYPGFSGLLLILYLAMLSAVAFGITSVLMKYNPVSRVSVFAFFNPIFGVCLSMLILGESSQDFGLRGVIALMLVCLGVFTVNHTKKPAQ